MHECFSPRGLCAGWNHTSDAVLERVFTQHRADFDALLAEVQGDSQLKSIQPRSIVYGDQSINVAESGVSEVERLGLPRERWDLYQKQLQRLGLAGGVFKTEGRIEFRVDPGSISNGDSYKGYEYSLSPPARMLPSLDGYRIAPRDRTRFGGWLVHKRLTQSWYLYLFVND